MRLIKGDCLEVMDKLIEEGVKVDAIITDPPYGTMNNAGLDGWEGNKTSWDNKIPHKEMLDKCNKLLRLNGCLCLFSQDPYTGQLMTDQHENIPFSYRLTWLKDHFANALISKKAPVNYTEDICLFFKKYDTDGLHPLRHYADKIKNYINKPKKEIFEIMGNQGVCHFFRTDSTQFTLCTEKTYSNLISIFKINTKEWFKPYHKLVEIDKAFNKTFNLPEGKKFKSNVLQYKKDYSGLHPTQKPVALIEDLIKTYTNEGDIVLDFTCGSGSTGVACKNLNRDFIGIELDDKYFEIAKKRIESV